MICEVCKDPNKETTSLEHVAFGKPIFQMILCSDCRIMSNNVMRLLSKNLTPREPEGVMAGEGRTPGEWKVNALPHGYSITAVQGRNLVAVARIPEFYSEIFGQGIQRNHMKADADLMAAAPEMLDALNKMLDHFGVFDDEDLLIHEDARAACHAARIAVARAMGVGLC